MDILAAIKDFGVFKSIASAALCGLVIYMFMPKGGGKGNSKNNTPTNSSNTNTN